MYPPAVTFGGLAPISLYVSVDAVDDEAIAFVTPNEVFDDVSVPFLNSEYQIHF
jgi:hypothetical protein